MMRHRFGFVAAVLLVMAMLLSACGSTPTPTPGSTPATGADNTPATGAGKPTEATSTGSETPAGGEAKPTVPKGPADPDSLVRIGFAFVTSGDNAVYGASQRKAAEMAWKEWEAQGGINGHSIAAIFEDTAGKPDQAISVFQKLMGIDNVIALVGPTLSQEAKSSDVEAQKAGVPVLAVSNTAAGITEIGDYIFRDSLSEAQVIPETIKQAKEKLGIKTASILYAQDDAFSKSGYDVFKQELTNNGIEIKSEQTFSTNDTDFKAQLTAIKADNPDAIVVSALAKPAQTILQQARTDIGIDAKVHIIGGNGFNSPAVIKAAGTAAEGLVVGAAWNIGSDNELSKKFVEDYKKLYGADPDQFAAQSYAGFNILADAIKRANIQDYKAVNLKDNRAAVRDALKATKDFPTVLGSFSFTDGRDASHPSVVQMVKDGKFEILK
jgi:branched-chain amino acid transport system substrate-binding protein